MHAEQSLLTIYIYSSQFIAAGIYIILIKVQPHIYREYDFHPFLAAVHFPTIIPKDLSGHHTTSRKSLLRAILTTATPLDINDYMCFVSNWVWDGLKFMLITISMSRTISKHTIENCPKNLPFEYNIIMAMCLLSQSIE